MKKIAVMMAQGCEEIEALTVVDVLRRGKFDVTTVSVSGDKNITSSHNVTFLADKLFSEMNFEEFDGIVLPGGMPGTTNLGQHQELGEVLLKMNGAGKLVAAICAAPSVLGGLGILDGKKATSFPSFSDKLGGACYVNEAAVVDGNIITGRGMGAAIDFSLAIVEYFSDEATATALGKNFEYYR